MNDLARWKSALEKHGIVCHLRAEYGWMDVCGHGGPVKLWHQNDDDHSDAELISRVTDWVLPDHSYIWMGGRVCLVKINGRLASASWTDFHTDDETYWHDSERDALLDALEKTEAKP